MAAKGEPVERQADGAETHERAIQHVPDRMRPVRGGAGERKPDGQRLGGDGTGPGRDDP
jgi:hypothetical protein